METERRTDRQKTTSNTEQYDLKHLFSLLLHAIHTKTLRHVPMGRSLWKTTTPYRYYHGTKLLLPLFILYNVSHLDNKNVKKNNQTVWSYIYIPQPSLHNMKIKINEFNTREKEGIMMYMQMHKKQNKKTSRKIYIYSDV